MQHLREVPLVAEALRRYKADRNNKNLHDLKCALTAAGITVPSQRNRLIKAMTTRPGQQHQGDI